MDSGLLLAARLEIEPFSPVARTRAGAIEPLAPPSSPPPAAWIREAVRAVAEHQRSGRSEGVWPLFRVLEPLLAGLGERDPAGAGGVLGALATQALVEGDWEAFLDRARRAAEAFERAGDGGAAAGERAALGGGYRMLGAWEDAERALRAALAGAPGREVAARARLDLARVLAARGTRVEARELAAAAAASFGGAGDGAWEGAARAVLAGMDAAAGEGAAALAEARRAMALLASSPGGRAFAGWALARALLAEGDVAAALTAAERARGEGEAIGRLPEGEIPVRLALADARGATGDRDGVAAALGEARRLVLADAAKLRDPALRRAFLEAVPDHRRALEPPA
jgi:eukaryotic-like serine/threonine-protein kinase